MTVVSCSVDERYVNPLFEVFDGGDFILSSYRDVEDVRTTMQIFFPDSADAPRAVAALVAAGEIVGVDLKPETGSIPDEDWRLSYRKHFKTEVISPRLAIVPEWELAGFTAKTAGSPAPRVLILDPGMAFGTGQHATTHACLEYIDELAVENADRSFLDVGCGSGILAIAAKLEGFRDVAGFDIDPDAVENANENAAKNGLGAEIRRCRASTGRATARSTWWRRTSSVPSSCALRRRSRRSSRRVGASSSPASWRRSIPRFGRPTRRAASARCPRS